MANSFQNIQLVTNEALRLLVNQLTISKYINRQLEDKYGVEGAKVGSTIYVRKPQKWAIRTGQTVDIQAIQDQTVPVSVYPQIGVDMDWFSLEGKLNLDDISERLISPAVQTIANKIDLDVAGQFTNIYQSVGTPGTPATSVATFFSAKQKLDEASAPKAPRRLILAPRQDTAIASNLTQLYNPQPVISKQYETGEMARLAGFQFEMDQNIQAFTTTAYAGDSPTVTSVTNGSTVVTGSWTTSQTVLNPGDVFTFGGVYSVNTMNKQSTGSLQQFTVTSSATSSGGGAATLSITPTMVISGAYQNVTNFPTAGQAVTVVGPASTLGFQGLAFCPDAFTLAMIDLPIPRGVDLAYRASDPQLGLSIRLIRDYDSVHDLWITRLDALYALGTLRPELAVRVQG